MADPTPAPVVFLDRDGVINRDSEAYITSIRELELIPGSLEAIRLLTEAGRPVIVVTNQSAVGRGMLAERDLIDMHDHLKAAVQEVGGEILDIYYCPHAPEAGCRCRKPRTGMIAAAGTRYRIDLRSAALVGDRAGDIRCARNAGIGLAIGVRSGITDPGPELTQAGIVPDHTADDLLAAVRWLLSRKPL